MKSDNTLLHNIGDQFTLYGRYTHGSPYGSGHIHDTYILTYNYKGTKTRYILQRINDHVFKEPEKVMENVQRVTQHIFHKLKGNGVQDITRACLQVIPSKAGVSYIIDEKNKYWRCFLCIEEAHTRDIVETEAHAFAAGKAFAQFQKLLVDLPDGKLHETIPDFHNTRKRFHSFENTVQADVSNRVQNCKREIEFALQRKEYASVLIDLINKGDLPERITHNDTKLNNVMLDDQTDEALCVIDLDTVMPGTVLYDFGDMVRTTTSSAAEDEKDLSKVSLKVSWFEALACGYLSEARGFLTDIERKYLVFSGKLITFEQGIRFLTDYLEGDTYYKIQNGTHNLDRCSNQFKLVESIEEKEGELEGIVRRILSE